MFLHYFALQFRRAPLLFLLFFQIGATLRDDGEGETYESTLDHDVAFASNKANDVTTRSSRRR
jgi:hypothetical protein